MLKKRNKPNVFQVRKGTKEDNNVERYSTYNEGKAVVIERWNRTIKGRMWRYFSAKNTYVYFDVLPKLVNDYNKAKHSTIKMSPDESKLA